MQILVDTFQGNVVDEQALLAAGVSGRILRINTVYGKFIKDTAFDDEWRKAAAFPVRMIYFVYDPDATGQQNYDWLAANIPPACTAVSLDVEIRPSSGISAAWVGQQLAACVKLCQAHWKTSIYTGAWFLSFISGWPACEYWWAQYPSALYPAAAVHTTWDALKAQLSALAWPPANYKQCPGTVKLWQCSGDRLILPGCATPLDICIWPGDLQSLAAWTGSTPPVSMTRDECLDDLLKKNGYSWQ
jgi:hypothetical protein